MIHRAPVLLLPALVFALLFLLPGCGEDPPVTPDPVVSTVDSTLDPPSSLAAASPDSVSVRLTWSPPVDTGSISYVLRWHRTTLLSDSGMQTVPASSTPFAIVTGLVTDTLYTFELYSFRNGKRSAASVMTTARPVRAVVIPPTAPAAPTGVKAVSTSATAVGLVWTAPTDTRTLTYRVDAIATGPATDTVTMSGITGTRTTVTGLNAGTAYTFKVYTIAGGETSATSGDVTWAGAARYNAGGMSMRIYEFASSSGAGLILDPAKGGPANISLTVPSTNVQLAMFNDDQDTPGATTLRLGSAYGIEEYMNVNGFDQNTYVSDSVYAVPQLDAWYETQPLTARFSSGTGNLKSFRINTQVTGSNTYMFYVRTGTAGNYHYARVLVKKDGAGKILQGNAPNRYVELEISYQLTPDLPYAKIPAGARTPVGIIPATRGR